MQIMSWKRVTLYLQHNYDYGWFCSLFCSCVNEWSIMCFLFYPLWPGSERALGPFLWEGKPNELSKPNTTTDHVNVVCSGTFGERKKIKPDISFFRKRLSFYQFLSYFSWVSQFLSFYHQFLSLSSLVYQLFFCQLFFVSFWVFLSSVSELFFRSMMQPSTFGRWWWVAPSAGRCGTQQALGWRSSKLVEVFWLGKIHGLIEFNGFEWMLMDFNGCLMDVNGF